MWREALGAWLRVRAAARHGPALPAARRSLLAAWQAVRRRPEAVFSALVVLGVAVMILHWS